ncbi:MAG: DUF4160 domain-containing protein [bacterium]
MVQVRKRTNGISYSMYNRNEHERGHIHVQYAGKAGQAEFAASIDIQTQQVIEGSLPAKQLREAVRWIESHQAELLEMWRIRNQPNGIQRIEE